jgi:PucR family transcriptional regulator, purine catabolism regulatory protein
VTLLLRDVLDLDVFSRGHPEILAGRDCLDRPVRWVHIADISEIAPLLKGGELLLTSGLGLATDAAGQTRYIEDLARVGIAGLVLTLGWSIAEVPAAMVEAAERCHVPVVALHDPIPFVEVTEQVHAEIINRQYLLLQKAEQIGKDFTRLVIRGAGIRQIVEALGRIIDKQVVLEDAAHQVIEYWVEEGSGSDVLESWEAHSRAGHHPSGESMSVTVEEGTGACAWIAIPLRDELWGRIHMLPLGTPIDEIDKLALDRAAAAVALSLLASRDAAQLVNRAKGDLIGDIMRGNFTSPQQVYGRARTLGTDLSNRRLFAVIVDADDFAGYVERRRLDETAAQRVKLGLLAETRAALEAVECTAISAIESDQVASILALEAAVDGDKLLARLGEELRHRVPASLEGLTATVGVSREANVEGLPRAFEEAREAVIYGKNATARRPIHRFEDLGLHRLILRLQELSELPQFVESELGPLLEHDARSSLKLVPTLRAYLDNGANKSATARAIHLERRSLYHRLHKISRLLECDLEDMETCARLFIAVKSLDLVRRSPTQR